MDNLTLGRKCPICETLTVLDEPTQDDADIYCQGAGCHWLDRVGCLEYNRVLEMIRMQGADRTSAGELIG